VAGFLAKCALFCPVVLLFSNLQFTFRGRHGWLSSLPLALAGVAYAILQIQLKPSRPTLLKRLLLAAAFIFWAIDQLLYAGRMATLIGDAVISAYVLDLFWMSQEQRQSHAPPGTPPTFRPGQPVPVLACNIAAISTADRPRYNDLVTRIRAAMQKRGEIPDGYSFNLDAKTVSLPETAQWIAMERLCCPFLTFNLSTCPDHADFILTLTGPEGVKPLLDAEFPSR
jgi:hypothetical protein